MPATADHSTDEELRRHLAFLTATVDNAGNLPDADDRIFAAADAMACVLNDELDDVTDDGYPTSTAISNLYQFTGTVEELIEEVADLSNQMGYGLVLVTTNDDQSRTVELATHGWSGMEEICAILARPGSMFHTLCWQSSHRGGLTVYNIPSHLWDQKEQWL